MAFFLFYGILKIHKLSPNILVLLYFDATEFHNHLDKGFTQSLLCYFYENTENTFIQLYNYLFIYLLTFES